MSTVPTLLPDVSELEPIVSLVLDSVSSPESKRAYQRAIRDFLTWYRFNGGGLVKATVQRYRSWLEGRHLAPRTVNLRLCAIRKLAGEAADNGLIPPEIAAGILRVSGTRVSGVRMGNWISRDQAEALVRSPDPTTNKGKRDRVILGLLVGCGLRRQELVKLTIAEIQQREGRWVICDLVGKGGRVRTVPIQGWAKALVDAWVEAAGLSGGRLLRSVNKADVVNGATLTPQAIFRVVKDYAVDIGLNLAPHDLRRSFTKMAYRGGAPLQQIRAALGHSSIRTTERYLGLELDLEDAACDHIKLDPEAKK